MASSGSNSHVLTYEGCNFLRQRLVLATLSNRPVKIKKIRSKDANPGVQDFEASFIRLLDRITNGSRIEVNETGTTVYYQPGLLHGGKIEHDCNEQRAIGYYLEALICLAPFTKEPLHATLRGVTNDQVDVSVDYLKATCLPLLQQFGLIANLDLKITKRGAAPEGGGEVIFTCPNPRKLRPVKTTDFGKIKRIRGWAFATRVSPQTANRIVESARGVLNRCLTDIYIYTDHRKGQQGGKSPGFGLTLVAETTTGVMLGSEAVSRPKGVDGDPTVPEDLGRGASKLLLEEIYRGGCVDSVNQSIALLFMALGDQDVSKAVLGPLTPYTIQFLRHLQDFFKVIFKIETLKADDDTELCTGADKIQLTCIGVGYTNLSKKTS
ncbi:RCL1 [Branchiostoma lanceolatum]|uniref:RCL1 protein n=1 Tax=Branchiostoma lanceolatum TaxID=7740 RepID=A0A8J9ZHG6_BRALA|nr:RCL1 [Branchiostoma lanceolatum]